MSDHPTLAALRRRFESGNGVPVERAYLTAEEFGRLEAELQDAARYRWMRAQLIDGSVIRAAMVPEPCAASLDRCIDEALQQEAGRG